MKTRTLFCFAFSALLATSAHAQTDRTFLVNGKNLSPILQLTTPKAGAACSAREVRLSVVYNNQVRAQICDNGKCTTADPNSLVYRDRFSRVDSVNLRAATGDPARSLPEPVTDTSGLMWLCREEEDLKQCICIPWFPPDSEKD